LSELYFASVSLESIWNSKIADDSLESIWNSKIAGDSLESF
jgi:hypothetical protein